MHCKICLEEKDKSLFHKWEQKIGDKIFHTDYLPYCILCLDINLIKWENNTPIIFKETFRKLFNQHQINKIGVDINTMIPQIEIEKQLQIDHREIQKYSNILGIKYIKIPFLNEKDNSVSKNYHLYFRREDIERLKLFVKKGKFIQRCKTTNIKLIPDNINTFISLDGKEYIFIDKTAVSKLCVGCLINKPLTEFPQSICSVSYYCKECHRKDAIQRYDNFSEEEKQKQRAATRLWNKNNKHLVKQYKKKPHNKLKNNVRKRISGLVKEIANSLKIQKPKLPKTKILLSCSLDYFQKYLESKFQPGMTWENYGEWHIDHIKPLCLFNLTDPNQILKASHYTNLQPLWAKDNYLKGAKHIDHTV